MYIAIEGIDTAGKSTQIKALGERYPDALITKEPGATRLGIKLREIVLFSEIKNPVSELLIFLADRAEHIAEVVEPNLDKTIISDRSVISGIAYADVVGHFEIEKLVELNRFACNEIFPKKAVVLKLSRDELAYRLSQKEHDKIEKRGIDYLLSIQDSLIKAAKALDIELLEIDASLHIEEITDEIVKFIEGKN
ncbi:dTMP kinase [Sulfurimonas sp. HSL-1716]|uniref:dTMP kinase n=1 Tax=Hydrocurvibacter sulfurireducens TaxID=3131937 RepID=UPI0031F90ED2